MSTVFEIIGMVFELIGAFIVVMDKIPILNKVSKQMYQFKQINKGLGKLTHKTLDEKSEDIILCESDEGFKEILSIINEKYGPYPDDIEMICFTYFSKQRTLGISQWSVQLVGKNNQRYYPTMMRELLHTIDVWKDMYFIYLGFKFFLVGILIQIFNIIYEFRFC